MAKTRRRKERERLARLAEQLHLAPCPQPYKAPFPSPHAADTALGTIWRKNRQAGRLPTRTYQCECGAWHLTSK